MFSHEEGHYSSHLCNDHLLYSAGSSPAPLRSCGPPVKRPNQWSFYSSMEEVDQLIEALNPRGHRESSLKEALLQERERLQHILQNCDQNKYSHTGINTGEPHRYQHR